MTLEEINDKFRDHCAYSNFITVQEAKEFGLIPRIYYEDCGDDAGTFPNHCICGSENILTRDLQQPQCCNPRCHVKMGYGLSELFTRFSIKGIGNALCLRMVNGCYSKLQYKSYIELISMSQSDYPYSIQGTVAADNFYLACYKIRQETLTFPAMIAKLGLPELNTSSIILFDRINCFKDLLAEINRLGGVKQFCNNRGVYDMSKIYWLHNSLIDIALAEIVFCRTLRRAGLHRIDICITGRVLIDGVHYTKDEFVKYCNSLGKLEDGTQLFELRQTTALETVNYIVADTPSTSRKYMAGKRRGVLITSKDLINKLKEVNGKWQSRLENNNQQSMKTSEVFQM